MPEAQVIERIRQKFANIAQDLDERGRRRWAATEALSLGRGGLMVTGGVVASEKPQDCCTAKLACCKEKSPCCEATARLGCCEKGLKCCDENKGCCAAVQKCCTAPEHKKP
ncbi:MAG TPA: hypothetical protein VGM05_27885 [Planctomycetaceae bacterium]|jgi:hypothetical protein